MFKTRATSLVSVWLVASACGSGQPSSKEHSNADVTSVSEGMIKTEEGWVLRTGELVVDPGQERYLCYAATAKEDLKINRFSFVKTPGIHHFIFDEASSPEKEGLSECNVLQITGATLFTATTASVELETPSGSAKLVAKGSQLVLQAHLLNTTESPIKTVIEIRMAKSPVLDPEPVGILGFGSANIVLPPRQVTTVESTCRLDEDARFYAIVPHMHYLGKRLELAFGPDEGSLESAYVRDPYSFDDQHFDPFERTVPAGTVARVRCTYDNDTDQTVRFGESSHDEMCNLPGFVVGRGDVKLCTQRLSVDGGVARAPDAGVCGLTVTSSGIGAVCTPGGGECGKDLACSADYLNMPVGICVQVGCSSNDECGGATCCAVSAVAGLANFCVPEACRPDTCIPVGSR
jgi:hypothetical protein